MAQEVVEERKEVVEEREEVVERKEEVTRKEEVVEPRAGPAGRPFPCPVCGGWFRSRQLLQQRALSPLWLRGRPWWSTKTRTPQGIAFPASC